MDYDTYRKSFFVEPQPQQRFKFAGLHGLTLYFGEYDQAIAFYKRVLGPPAYIEGQGTHGWLIGDTWLTLLAGTDKNPQNIEMMIVMQSPGEVDRFYKVFIEAGGSGSPPEDQVMYEPVHYCLLKDPLGTDIVVTCPLKH